MASIAGEAVREFPQKRFWDEYNAAYAALAADPEDWTAFQRETEAWEVMLAGGRKGQCDAPPRGSSRQESRAKR